MAGVFFARPKSPSLTRAASGDMAEAVMKTFEGVMSPCTQPWLCTWSTARASCENIADTEDAVRDGERRRCWAREGSEQSSIWMKRYSDGARGGWLGREEGDLSFERLCMVSSEAVDCREEEEQVEAREELEEEKREAEEREGEEVGEVSCMVQERAGDTELHSVQAVW